MASKKKHGRVETEQRAAAFRFLPFTVDLFSRRGLRMKRADLVPVRQPKSLTLEVVEALEEVMSHGTLAFLCRQGGWRALAVAEPGREEPARGVRLIDERVWARAGLELRFGDEAIDALLIAYNAVCRAGGQNPPGQRVKKKGGRDAYPSRVPMGFERNGDVFVHHIAWLKIREAPFKVDDAHWRYLIENPLTRLARFDARDVEAGEVVARLLEPDIGPLLRWLGPHLVRCWLRELETRWDTLERFHRLNTGMAEYFDAILEVSRTEERRDLLVPLLEFFRWHLRREDVEMLWEREFNRLARDLRFADRDEYRRMWARGVGVGWALFEEYGEARSVHPIDREAPDRVYMEAFERQPYEPLAWRARAFANQLNSVIS